MQTNARGRMSMVENKLRYKMDIFSIITLQNIPHKEHLP